MTQLPDTSLSADIRSAASLLQFQEPQQTTYARLRQLFGRQILHLFRAITEEVRTVDPHLYAKTLDKLSTLLEGASILLTPEFAGKVLDYPYGNAVNICAFFLQSMDASLAKAAGSFDRNLYPALWSGEGDFFIRFDPEAQQFRRYDAFSIGEDITLDFFSPYCIRIDNQELGEPEGAIIEEYDYPEAFSLYEKLDDTFNAFHGQPAGHLISHFTRTILLKKLTSNGQTYFSSASNFPWIGRTLLLNAGAASQSQLADALVHESTHSLLYTINVLNKWMPPNSTIRQLGRHIISPWTSRLLDTGNYLQAIFVWYALSNFWQQALEQQTFDQAFGIERIRMIRSGFTKVDIRQLNDSCQLQLKEELMGTIERVRHQILHS